MPNTVSLHRVFKASPEKIFKAFADVRAYASWIAPYGFICEVDLFDFQIGGKYHASFINFTTGNSHSFGGTFLDIIQNIRLQYDDVFDDPSMSGTMITTIILNPVVCGTEIHITQEGIPDMIPLAMCYLGWQESLEKLKALVEPEIPNP